MLDETQHLVEKKSHRLIHNVADWLKIMIDDTRTTLVIAGLPSCLGVLSQNEQLARRFLSPVQLPRFDWNNNEQRREFLGILKAYALPLSSRYSLPVLHSAEFGFRIWKATGGLMAYVAKLFRQVERNASISGSSSVGLPEFRQAYKQAICTFNADLQTLDPFGDVLPAADDAAEIRTAMQLGIPQLENRLVKRGRPTTSRKESLHSALSR